MGLGAVEVSEVLTSSAADGTSTNNGTSTTFTTGNCTQADTYALAVGAFGSPSALSTLLYPTAPLQIAVAITSAGQQPFVMIVGITTGTTNLTINPGSSLAFIATGGKLKINQPAGGSAGMLYVPNLEGV